MPTVEASEFQKRVGEYSDIARRETVTVTNQGRPSLVLISAEDHARLKAIEGRASRAVAIAELPCESVEALRDADLSHLPSD